MVDMRHHTRCSDIVSFCAICSVCDVVSLEKCVLPTRDRNCGRDLAKCIISPFVQI